MKNNPAKVRLPGHCPEKALKEAVLVEKLDADKTLPVTFLLPLRNQGELDRLIERLYDPSDREHFGKYLSTEEFIERFAPTQSDYDAVIAYAEEMGLTISETHANRTILNTVGRVESHEKAFNIELHRYRLSDGREFHAPTDNPELPSSIASIIGGVLGLDNHAKWKTHHRRKEAEEPSFQTEAFTPKGISVAYNLTKVPENGSGQIVALFELATYQESDINTYAKTFGLPKPKLKNILVAGGSGEKINPEVTLDIELAIALAPQSEIYVYEGPNSHIGVVNTYNRIALDNIAKQVSTSWGLGENLVIPPVLFAEYRIFQQMAAQGQTIYSASGDYGACGDCPFGDCKTLVVSDPASQPYMVGVGGTTLMVNQTTGAYEGECIWNNGVAEGASGGGVTRIWPIPEWQKCVPYAASKNMRNVPDVALNGDPNTGYYIFFDSKWWIFGGTSASAPLWGAFTALVNQRRVAARMHVLGFANPHLYAIAKGRCYSTVFHIVPCGNNYCEDHSGFAATKGYNNATGLGSFNGAKMFAALTKRPRESWLSRFFM